MVGLRLNRAISLGESVAAHDIDLGLETCEGGVGEGWEREKQYSSRDRGWKSQSVASSRTCLLKLLQTMENFNFELQ